MKRTITKTDKKGRETVWEWEETPELTEFIKKQTTPQVKPKPVRPNEAN